MEYQMMRQHIFEKRKKQTPKMTFVFDLSRRMSTRNVEFWQTTGNDDAIDSLSQILPYESTRYAFESHFL